MARKYGKNETTLSNVIKLVKALLDLADGKIAVPGDKLKATFKVEWVKEDELLVSGKVQQKRNNRTQTVEKGITKEDLWTLVKCSGEALELSQPKDEKKVDQTQRRSDAIQDVLDCLKDLEILDLKHSAKNQGFWKFSLKLKHQTKKEENLKLIDDKWKIKVGTVTVETSHETTLESSQNLPISVDIPQNLPISGVAKFVGRKKELQNLHNQLQANAEVALSAIAGMGGVGKTELAIQYALLHRQDYPGGICWINSRGTDVGKQIVYFATNELRLRSDHIGNVDGQVRYCWNNWQRQGNVLVVFDDLTDYEKIKRYSPPEKSRFKVLITTREKMRNPVVRIDLEVLTSDDAVDLLKSLIGNERVKRELEITTQLCGWLGYLPLALELVGRYLERHQTQTIKDLLSQLQEGASFKHSAMTKPAKEMTAQRGLEAAFDLSWNELNDCAKQLGCLLSLFDLKAIPLLLVEKSILVEKSSDGVSLSTLADLRTDFAKNGAEKSETFANLVGLNLVKGEGTYRLHELIRELFHNKLDEPDTKALQRDFSEGMLEVAKKAFESPNFSMTELKILFDFLLQVPTAGRYEGTLLKFLELLFPYYKIQQYIYDTGYLESAIEKLERAKAYLKQLGESNNINAQITNNKMLGHAYYANPDQNRDLAIENMIIAKDIATEAYKSCTSDSKHQVWLWYLIFLLNHLHNLLSKPSNQSSNLVDREELEDQINEFLPVSLQQIDSPTELDALPFLLRAACYWGHLGNQATFRLENLLHELPSTRNEEVETLLENGINYYSRASIFRLASFRLSFSQQHLADILDKIPEIPQWLLTWNAPANSLNFEQFTSESQAVGDIAHQYRGIAIIKLWGHLYYFSRGMSSSLLEEAERFVDVAVDLWKKAEERLKTGEQLIKYYAWIPHLEMMLELSREYSSHAQLRSEADVNREVTAKLDELESKHRLVYDWAKNQTIREIAHFYNMISRLNRL